MGEVNEPRPAEEEPEAPPEDDEEEDDAPAEQARARGARDQVYTPPPTIIRPEPAGTEGEVTAQ